MKIRKYIMAGLLLLLPAGALAEEARYDYPLEDSYAATILGTPKNLRTKTPCKVPIKTLTLETDRDKPEAFFYDRGLRYTVAFQDHKAPLVFLIAGTGGGSKTGKMLALTGSLYRAGYHVVGLPSPTFPNFIIDASTTHVPGHLPDDAADLYRVMEQIWARTRGRIEVSEFLLAGYSLGGTEAAFVMKLDEERKAFGFRRAMLLNPAISLYSSVSRIEGLLDRIPGGPRRIGAFHNRVMEKVNDFYRKRDFVAVDDDFLFAGYNAHLLTVVPGFARTGVSNFFSNLREIRTFYNCVLQAKGKKSMVTLGRFLTNSTIGIGGLFDPATALGMRREVEEFDRTLETWGVGTGPYLVLPILGPNTARSASGFAVDAGVRWATMSAVDPFGGTGARTAIEEGVTGLETVDLRHRETFRYYDSNYPFEYYMVRYLFSQERELKILR